eukprot:g10915.t1
MSKKPVSIGDLPSSTHFCPKSSNHRLFHRWPRKRPRSSGNQSHGRYVAQLRREQQSRKEVQAALAAQREKSRYEEACEREESRSFAAQQLARSLQQEIEEAEALAAWRQKCQAVQEEEFRARAQQSRGNDGSTGYQIGRDVLGDLKATQQSKWQYAALRAGDLELRCKRKQEDRWVATGQLNPLQHRRIPTSTDPTAMAMPKRVVIIGHGPVGHILLEHLVEGTEVPLELTVICEEPHLAYNRVAMTSYFQHRSASELAMCSAEWLVEKNVQVIFARATQIQRSSRRIFLYRTIEDMEAILARAQQKGVRKAAVIGGGLLGLEAAKALLDLQMKVTVLEAAPTLMSAQLDMTGAELLRKRLMKIGLDIETQVNLQEVLSNASGVRFIRLEKEGQESFLEVDLLIISCGIRPRDELARQCQLELGTRGGVKPGSEQAEVLAGTLGSPSAGLRYHGSDLSTKLKLLGVNVASFGANAEFWQHRIFDCQDGQANWCVRSVLEGNKYRKLVFRRLPSGGRKLVGGILVESVEDYQSLCDVARCGRELWGLETVVMTHGPRANPGQIEDMVYPRDFPAPVLDMAAMPAVRVVQRERRMAITVLCEEPHLAYNRVAMTSYFQHRSVCELAMCSPDWLQEKNIQVIFARATSIKRSHKQVTYEGPSGSGEVGYDELVLATGSAPFVPPVPGLASTAGVFLYRTIEDMDAIIARAGSARGTTRRAAVVGGGLLGLEAAKALLDLGLETHVFESAPHLMPSQLDSVAGELLKKQIETRPSQDTVMTLFFANRLW